LALRHGSLSGGDWTDVAANLIAFEAINNVRLEIRMATGDHKGAADLLLTALAFPRVTEQPAVPPLGSASATCSGTNRKSLEGALIQLLYQLDAKLASGVFAEILDK